MEAGFAGGRGGGLLLSGEAYMKEGSAVEVHELPSADAEGALAHHVSFGLFDIGECEELLDESFGGGHGVSVRKVAPADALDALADTP